MNEPETVRCPFCRAAGAEMISLFGSQLLFSQFRCAACGSYFEGVRPDRWEEQTPFRTPGEKEHGR